MTAIHPWIARRLIGRSERPGLWAVILSLCAIAVAVSIRRLVALANPLASGSSDLVALDALFAAKAGLTRGHVISGLVLALLIPLQLSAAVRARLPRLHRWLGRLFMIVGSVVGLTGYAMVAIPVGGSLEIAAIVVYATAFLVSLLTAWRYIRRGDVARHREWMLRAMAIALGIATTRPVVGAFFATRALTGLSPSQFFGMAFWVGFTSLGGRLKTGNLSTGQNRQLSPAAETSEFYFAASSGRKSAWTLVRQLRGPHLSTCA